MSDNGNAKRKETYLTPQEVSERYGGKISVQTLSNWRSDKKNRKKYPVFLKAGGKVLYLLSELEKWERSRMS